MLGTPMVGTPMVGTPMAGTPMLGTPMPGIPCGMADALLTPPHCHPPWPSATAVI